MCDFLILGDRLKLLREQMKLTQKEFSELVGCTSATLSAYENGSKSPSLKIVKNIAEKTKVSIDWLCGLSDNQSNSLKLDTYEDIIDLFLQLEKKVELNTIFFKTWPPMAIIGFDNEDLSEFMYDWARIKELYDRKVIDDSMYLPWLDAKKRQYHKDINDAKTFMFDDLKNVIESEFSDH